MASEPRNLLFWDPLRAGTDLAAQLGQAGWRVSLAGCLDDARRRLASRHCPVGLACLNANQSRACRDFEQLLLDSQTVIQWLALVQPEDVRSDALSRLLADGVFDFHTFPVDSRRLLDSLGHAAGVAAIRASAHGTAAGDAITASGMVGNSPGMQQLFRQLDKIGQVEAPVLITGESGSGKELTALAIHRRSLRASGPLVAVNCAALPASLVQSELFGHEKGAFTGAVRRKIGRIESAAGGTLFLDEIGDLPLEQQTSLLRFLQEGTVDRVGGTHPVPVDARVIAATHQDLELAVDQGRFREDLYYRLNVLRLQVPPLRERTEDIEALAWRQFERFGRERGVQVKGFSEQALQCLLRHDWPGNVRELINRVRRAIVMADGRLITPADLGLDRRNGRRMVPSLQQVRAEAESRAIRTSLRLARNNLSEAARSLGISRVTLYRLLDKHRIPIGQAQEPGPAEGLRELRINGEASLEPGGWSCSTGRG